VDLVGIGMHGYALSATLARIGRRCAFWNICANISAAGGSTNSSLMRRVNVGLLIVATSADARLHGDG